MLFYQCTLRQGATKTVGWIEQRGAKVGARVEVPELGGMWQVVAVEPYAIDADWLREKQRFDRKGMPDI